MPSNIPVKARLLAAGTSRKRASSMCRLLAFPIVSLPPLAYASAGCEAPDSVAFAQQLFTQHRSFYFQETPS